MDLDLLKALGQVAGIGGIAIGAFLIICKEIVRKSIFPKFTKQQSTKVILTIAFMAWTTALAGIWAWVYVNNSHYDDLKSKAYVLLNPPFTTKISRFNHGPSDCVHHAVETLSVNSFNLNSNLDGFSCTYTINKHNTGHCRGLYFDEDSPSFAGIVRGQLSIENQNVIISNVEDIYPNNLEQTTKAGLPLVDHFNSKNGCIIN